jgi:two-component system sensor histidine kinase AgrC
MSLAINYQTVLILNSILLLWGIDVPFFLTKKTALLLNLYLAVTLLLSFRLSYDTNTILLILFAVIRFYILLFRFENWVIPIISFLWKFTLVAFLWFFTFFLPDILFGIEFTLSPKEVLPFLFVQLIGLLFFCWLTDYIIKKYRILTLLSNSRKKYKKEGLTILSLYIILFSTHLFIFSSYSISFFVFSFLTLVISAFLFMIFFYVIASSAQKIEEYQTSIATLAKIKEKYEQINDFRHDYNGLLLSLNGYLCADDTEGAKNYIHSLVNYSTNMLVPEYYTQLDKIPIPPIQSVLASFGEQALSENIKLHVDIKNSISYLEIEIIDFIRCLSILLCNAFEAVTTQKNPDVYVSLEKTDCHLLLQVKNQDFSNIPLQNMLIKGYTSKANNAGRGLNIILKICENYTGADFHIERMNQIFTATLSIKL